RLDVEEDEEQRHDVVARVEAHPGHPLRALAALVGLALEWARSAGADPEDLRPDEEAPHREEGDEEEGKKGEALGHAGCSGDCRGQLCHRTPRRAPSKSRPRCTAS